jgi:hypothetical protein
VIARIAFEYNAAERIEVIKKDPLLLEKLAQVLPQAMESTWWYGFETLIDMDVDGPILCELGIAFNVKSFKGTMPIQQVLPDGKSYTVYVQVPHIGLLAINEVQVLESACTDQLQARLNDGWRILAVCPPNAARRPDYILGRTKE